MTFCVNMVRPDDFSFVFFRVFSFILASILGAFLYVTIIRVRVWDSFRYIILPQKITNWKKPPFRVFMTDSNR